MAYVQHQHFSISDRQEKQLKHARITAACLAILLLISAATIFWLTSKLDQTSKAYTELLSDAQQLLQDKQNAEQNLSRVTQKLTDTESEFEKSFNTLYPAYIAVENIRYIGTNSQTYHRFDCSVFSPSSTYTAHDYEYCSVLGYTPCTVCCPD